MKLKAAAAVLLLLVSSSAWAQEVKLPTGVTGEPGDFVVVQAETADAQVSWYSVDSALKLFPTALLKDSKAAVVVSLRPGKYRLLAVSAKDGVPSPFAECVVTITGPAPPVVVVPPDTPDPPGPQATAATYVYEKDTTAIPAPVLSAIDKINRAQPPDAKKKIIASVFEQDTVDGSGETPEQYRAALAAAREAGLPALVVTAGDTVLRIVKNPRSEQDILGAVGVKK